MKCGVSQAIVTGVERNTPSCWTATPGGSPIGWVALTCGFATGDCGRSVTDGRRRVPSANLGRPRDGPGLITANGRSTDDGHPQYGWPEPQPTTASYDGGRADRPRTRVPRCTPTGLSHAASAVDQSKPRRSGRRRRLQVRLIQALSLGSCDHLRAARTLTSTNGSGATSSGWAAFTVIPRCSPLDLVRLWCGRGVLAAVARPTGSVVAERPVVGGDAGCGQARDARCSCWARPPSRVCTAAEHRRVQ